MEANQSAGPMRVVTADRSAYCNSCGAALDDGHQCAPKPRIFVTAGSTNVQSAPNPPPRADNLRAYCNACGATIEGDHHCDRGHAKEL